MALSKTQIIAVAAVVIVVVAAVGVYLVKSGGEDSPSSYEEGNVTIETYTAADGFIEQTYDSAPERIIVGNMTILETLLYFGLGDRIVAIYYLEDELWDNDYVKSEYQKVEQRIGSDHITDGTFSQAFLVDLEPDLIMGYASSFNETTFGTPSFWNALGCNVWSTYCLNSSRTLAQHTDWDTMDMMEADYANIGKVFDIEDQTNRFMDDFKSLVSTIEADSSIDSDLKVAISEYRSSRGTFSAYGNTSYSGWLLSLCGVQNYFPQGGTIAIETMVDATELDGYVLITYGTSSTISAFESEVINNDLYAHVPPLADDNYISWGLNGNYGGASAMDILQSLYDYIKTL